MAKVSGNDIWDFIVKECIFILLILFYTQICYSHNSCFMLNSFILHEGMIFEII